MDDVTNDTRSGRGEGETRPERVARRGPGRWSGFLAAIRRLFGLDWLLTPAPASKEVSFTIAFVGLAAKMAKADGVAVKVESEAFERCFRVPPEERANVKRVFDLAARDVAGFEAYAQQIARMLEHEPALKRDVFECLFNIAAADGVLHTAEEVFLKRVAAAFGFDAREFQHVRSLFVRDPTSPYEVLGVSPDIPDEELKAHYRGLVRENHPDKLAAEGVPAEFLVLADRKLAAINAAYEAIVKERGEVVRP